jgi:hypothetical protein
MTLAQYKGNCTQLKQLLKYGIVEVTAVQNTQGTTATQKKACVTLIAALKKAQTAVNTCDPKCNCNGKPITTDVNCINNALKPLDTAITNFNNVMDGYLLIS